MDTTQVKDVVGKAMSQAMGSEFMENTGFLTALESGKIIDVGKDITDVTKTVEKFANSLCDVIGKLIINTREYMPIVTQLYVDTMDWGGFIEEVDFDFTAFIDDPMFSLNTETDYSIAEHKFYRPIVKSKIYNESKAIALPVSIQLDDMRTAFHSFEEMNRFVSGIKSQIVQQIKYYLDVLSHMLLSGGVAISDKVTHTSVHLLTEAKANGILSSEDTATSALNNEKFLSYALERISNVKNYLRVPSTTFNNGTINKWAYKVNVAMLSDFANAEKFRLRANTFNEKLIGIGEFDTIPSWQGVATDSSHKFDFDTLSSIKIDDTLNKLGIGSSVTITNVVALVYDYKSLGVTQLLEKATSSYTAITDHTNTFYHNRFNYRINTDYPMIAFLLD